MVMWLRFFIGFNFICKLHSWSNGIFPEVCDSMRPLHGNGDTETPPQTSEPPFMVSYQLGSNVGDPVTVSLQSKTDARFRGFMLEARSLTSGGDGPALGKFILLEPTQTRLLKCGTLVDSAVSNKLNVRKSLIRVNWTREGEEGDIMFRATFLQEFYRYWERVNITLAGSTSTQKPEPTTVEATATTTTQMSTAEPGTTTTATLATKMSTAKPGTTTTATLTTQMSTAKPGTTTTATTTTQMSTAEPGTTTTATLATKMSTAKPGTTTTATPTTQMSTAKPGTTATQRSINSTKDITVVTLIVVFVEWKMEVCNIIMALLPTCFGHFLIKITRTVGSLCSFSLSLLTFILNWGSVEGGFIGLISAILVIGFIDLVIVLLPFGPSHKLNGHCDLGLRLCFALYHLLTNCFLHVKVYYLTEEWKETGRKIWLLYILIVQTMLIILAIVWNFVLYCNKRTLLHKVRAKGINGDHQGIKKFLRTCTVPFISLFFLVGITSISLWIIVELYDMQDD